MTLTTVARIPYESGIELGEQHFMPQTGLGRKPFIRRVWKVFIINPIPTLILLSGLGGLVFYRIDVLTTGLKNDLSASIIASNSSTNTNIARLDSSVAKAEGRIDGALNTLNGVAVSTTATLNSFTTKTSELYTRVEQSMDTSLGKLDSEIKTSVGKLNGAVASITDRLQSAKAHEINYVESFEVRVDENLIVQMHHGRILAFPLNDNKVTELRLAGFYQTEFRLRPNMIRGWAPSRDAIRNPSRFLDRTAEVPNNAGR